VLGKKTKGVFKLVVSLALNKSVKPNISFLSFLLLFYLSRLSYNCHNWAKEMAESVKPEVSQVDFDDGAKTMLRIIGWPPPR
jgi:hypothetical protein